MNRTAVQFATPAIEHVSAFCTPLNSQSRYSPGWPSGMRPGSSGQADVSWLLMHPGCSEDIRPRLSASASADPSLLFTDPGCHRGIGPMLPGPCIDIYPGSFRAQPREQTGSRIHHQERRHEEPSLFETRSCSSVPHIFSVARHYRYRPAAVASTWPTARSILAAKPNQCCNRKIKYNAVLANIHSVEFRTVP